MSCRHGVIGILRLPASLRAADGSPIVDLQPSDFTVRADGDPRAVLPASCFGDRAAPISEPTPIGRFVAIVEVTYREDPAMLMLMPATMREWYSMPLGGITGEASYPDDRRFQTTVRLT
jgi:hypothetical protein